MAKHNTVKLDTSVFEHFLNDLQKVGGNARETATKALEKAAVIIREDTISAMDDANLPAGGKFSSGDTKRSIITDTAPRWEGDVGWVPVGFDFDKPGAGGYLISGTPRMAPDKALHAMFKEKKYMRGIEADMAKVVLQELIDKM